MPVRIILLTYLLSNSQSSFIFEQFFWIPVILIDDVRPDFKKWLKRNPNMTYFATAIKEKIVLEVGRFEKTLISAYHRAEGAQGAKWEIWIEVSSGLKGNDNDTLENLLL